MVILHVYDVRSRGISLTNEHRHEADFVIEAVYELAGMARRGRVIRDPIADESRPLLN